ncbi:glycosyltransferase family 8 protein [Halomonas sp. S2151]|uniref:glycosyltransferase family 8 protein n=1 Tax=Halomonas sp. S2151 TaxID=579478 RepID=UPI000A0191E3|nr:glycosyltransferase [Halomonas sp. S2151]
MIKKKHCNIVFVSDKRFLPVVVFTAELYRKYGYDISLITDCNEYNEELFSTFKSVKIVDSTDFSFKESKRIPVVAYLKLLIPYLFKDEYEYSLYIDADALPNVSEKVFNQSVNRNISFSKIKAVGAVPHVGVPRAVLKKTDFGCYYNSGVLFFNNSSEHHLTPRSLEEVYERFSDVVVFEDQCLINHYYRDKIYRLPVCWNLTTDWFYFDNVKVEGIIHYTALFGKPHEKVFFHPCKLGTVEGLANVLDQISASKSGSMKNLIKYFLYKAGVYIPYRIKR